MLADWVAQYPNPIRKTFIAVGVDVNRLLMSGWTPGASPCGAFLSNTPEPLISEIVRCVEVGGIVALQCEQPGIVDLLQDAGLIILDKRPGVWFCRRSV